MFSVEVSATPGSVNVQTTSNRGMNSEEIALNAVEKIISISDTADPVIKAQAEAFKENIRTVLVHYMREAVRSHHVTLANKFKRAGHPEFIKLLDE